MLLNARLVAIAVVITILFAPINFFVGFMLLRHGVRPGVLVAAVVAYCIPAIVHLIRPEVDIFY